MAAERARTEAEERRKRDEEAARLAKAEADRVRELQVRWQCSGSSAPCCSIVFAQFACKIRQLRQFMQTCTSVFPSAKRSASCFVWQGGVTDVQSGRNHRLTCCLSSDIQCGPMRR